MKIIVSCSPKRDNGFHMAFTHYISVIQNNASNILCNHYTTDPS